jgi:hypothetical protein
MDQDDLGWIGKLQPFGTADAAKCEVQLGRCASLGQALWGTTAEHLRRQLAKSSPDLPSGFDLEDFRQLQIHASRFASLNLDLPRHAWARPILLQARRIDVGMQQFNEWEARVEIVRRAIDFLQKH